jgi:hypothetical protein
LCDAGVSKENIEGVLSILALLFVPIRETVEKHHANSEDMENLGRRRCVRHPDYFDRYFAFSAPAEDIADSVVAEAIGQLGDGTIGPEVDRLKGFLITDTSRVRRKIEALPRHSPRAPRRPLTAGQPGRRAASHTEDRKHLGRRRL